MKKWIIRYRSKDDDTSRVWLEAETAEDARRRVHYDYWDIDEILDVYEA